MSFFSPLGLSADRRVRLCAHLTLLRRDGGDIQLGWECSDAVVLTEVDAGLVQLLEVLDGRYRVAELFTAAESMGVSAEDVTRLLRTLHAAELLEHDVVDHRSRKPGSPQTGGVRLVGLDPAGVRIGEQLLRSGIERLIVVDPTVPETSLTRRRTRAEEFRGRWGDQPGRVLVANHWSKPDGERLDLTVVVSSTLEVDRAVVTGLTHDGAPHLLVRPRANGAVVGPLVLPGQSSCIRCSDLLRSRADPSWPRMLAQLCRIPGSWHPLAVDWASAQATTQVLAHLSGRPTETRSATLELGPRDWAWTRRTWPADPACGCCWMPHAEW
ncbi:MAG: hypothetical protein L0H41_04390 [Microlunatus sp.]|nr:hypothetical protein [Microlunatus sp.]MDN5770713.1 hypothetical protein [Microlunatus sp.]